MTYRQAVWGFSNGVTVLALGGLVWFSVAFGLGLGPLLGVAGRPFIIGLAVLMYLGFGLLFLAALRLRRRATGFRLSEARRGSAQQREETRRITRGFYLVNIGQLGLILLTVFACTYFDRPALILPFVGLIVSVHFVPLAVVFGINLYYWTGGLGASVALVSMLTADEPARSALLGVGIGTVAWASAVYLLWHADAMARTWAARGA